MLRVCILGALFLGAANIAHTSSKPQSARVVNYLYSLRDDLLISSKLAMFDNKSNNPHAYSSRPDAGSLKYSLESSIEINSAMSFKVMYFSLHNTHSQIKVDEKDKYKNCYAFGVACNFNFLGSKTTFIVDYLKANPDKTISKGISIGVNSSAMPYINYSLKLTGYKENARLQRDLELDINLNF